MAPKRPGSELKKLEELVGHFIQYWGFKKIHGRIWTHLYLSKEPLDSITLIKKLIVSKALMSLAIRDLLDYQVIEPVSVGKHGSTFYRANPDLMKVITQVFQQRELQMLSEVSECLDRLLSSENKNLEKIKIKNLKQLTESAQGLLSLFILQSSQQTPSDNLNIFSEMSFTND
jgi:DNA-binding transcriptional regulator GbsR (MarR family)